MTTPALGNVQRCTVAARTSPPAGSGAEDLQACAHDRDRRSRLLGYLRLGPIAFMHQFFEVQRVLDMPARGGIPNHGDYRNGDGNDRCVQYLSKQPSEKSNTGHDQRHGPSGPMFKPRNRGCSRSPYCGRQYGGQ
ncbi:hypothetical protein [Mycobacteroides abscessus]|uniref:hypothetical protein n=1 Tax=Mycobacteroides abscessus TaxID=36809 RepID=UPI0013F618B0|nr:hypothetical protein [Mycobacteroides abscessus]